MSSVGQKEITTQQRIMMLFRNNPSYIYFSEPGFTKPSSRVTTEETREKTREKILALIAENPRITTGEMAELLGITAKKC